MKYYKNTNYSGNTLLLRKKLFLIKTNSMILMLVFLGQQLLTRITIPAMKKTNENTSKKSYVIEPIRLKSVTLDFII